MRARILALWAFVVAWWISLWRREEPETPPIRDFKFRAVLWSPGAIERRVPDFAVEEDDLHALTIRVGRLLNRHPDLWTEGFRVTLEGPGDPPRAMNREERRAAQAAARVYDRRWGDGA